MDKDKPTTTAQAVCDNRETVSSYERCAEDYTQTTSGEPPEVHSQLLREFMRCVGRNAHVLEIGSGPGWDADRLEAGGIEVVRTDITQAFIDVQTKRGKRITRLDVIGDEISGQYDGIMCLYVLQHIARPLIDAVLAKFSAALRPGGVLFVALRHGNGERRELGESSGGAYHLTLWPQHEFFDRLERAGVSVEQSRTFAGSEGEWLVVLARKPAG